MFSRVSLSALRLLPPPVDRETSMVQIRVRPPMRPPPRSCHKAQRPPYRWPCHTRLSPPDTNTVPVQLPVPHCSTSLRRWWLGRSPGVLAYSAHGISLSVLGIQLSAAPQNGHMRRAKARWLQKGHRHRVPYAGRRDFLLLFMVFLPSPDALLPPDHGAPGRRAASAAQTRLERSSGW